MSPHDLRWVVAEQLRRGAELEGAVRGQGAAVRERAKRAYPVDLLDARAQLVGLAAELLQTRAGQPAGADGSVVRRHLLCAAFLQGTTFTEDLISEGQYVKAAAALRQDLELLARLGELRAGTTPPRSVPNVRYAPTGSGVSYGQLSKAVHLDADVVEDLMATAPADGGAVGVSVLPAFVEEAAIGMYRLHVCQLVEVVREMVVMHVGLHGEADDLESIAARWLAVARQLEASGHIDLAPVPK